MPFIRQGVWCACESSFNSSSNILEQGVSVYACDGAATDGWVPTGDAWDKNGSAARRALDRELGSEWFLVEGATLEALGADREPLLRKVTFISRLTWDGASGRFFEATGDQPEIRTHATHTQQSYEDIYNAM